MRHDEQTIRGSLCCASDHSGSGGFVANALGCDKHGKPMSNCALYLGGLLIGLSFAIDSWTGVLVCSIGLVLVLSARWL